MYLWLVKTITSTRTKQRVGFDSREVRQCYCCTLIYI